MATPVIEIVIIDELGNRSVVGTARISALDIIRDLITIPTEVLEILISELNIYKLEKVGILNSLRKTNKGEFKTVSDLVKVSEDDFLRIEGIGRKSLKHVNEALKPFGLRVGFFV